MWVVWGKRKRIKNVKENVRKCSNAINWSKGEYFEFFTDKKKSKFRRVLFLLENEVLIKRSESEYFDFLLLEKEVTLEECFFLMEKWITYKRNKREYS